MARQLFRAVELPVHMGFKTVSISCILAQWFNKGNLGENEDHNSDLGGVDFFDQKRAAYKLGRKSSGRHFWSDGYLCCKFAWNLQSIAHKGNGITTLQNCWLVRIIVAVEIQRSIMCLTEKYFQLVSHYTSQFFKQREENVNTAILERLKTKHIQCNNCAAFLCLISGNRSRNCFANFHTEV